jgi:hypothetical protein
MEAWVWADGRGNKRFQSFVSMVATFGGWEGEVVGEEVAEEGLRGPGVVEVGALVKVEKEEMGSGEAGGALQEGVALGLLRSVGWVFGELVCPVEALEEAGIGGGGHEGSSPALGGGGRG